MHEASIIKALLDQLDALCARRQPAHLTRVTVEVGDRSGTNPDALAFAYAALAPGSCAADASLIIHPIATQLTCHACHARSLPDLPIVACRHCGSTNVGLAGATQLQLQSVDFDDEPPRAAELPGGRYV
jgi:hydrogenase nickel incorporation protein HypA/HybF